MKKKNLETTNLHNTARIILAIFMLFAGIGHLTFGRVDFQAQVPDWVPFSKDFVVISSGIVEIFLGSGLLLWKNKHTLFGWALALFFVLIFPGNIDQYLSGKDAFGIINSDSIRLTRLLFQPLLVIWAVWSSGAWQEWRANKKN